MDKHTLEKLAENLSQRQIAAKLNCSQTTIKYWLNKFGLKTKWGRKIAPFCRRCGETDISKLRKGCRYVCLSCDNKRTIERCKKQKEKAVNYKGGKCFVCGYEKCLSALEFHHCDPISKDPDWRRMRSRSFDSIKEELDKCVLLCSNCHKELHAGLINLRA